MIKILKLKDLNISNFLPKLSICKPKNHRQEIRDLLTLTKMEFLKISQPRDKGISRHNRILAEAKSNLEVLADHIAWILNFHSWRSPIMWHLFRFLNVQAINFLPDWRLFQVMMVESCNNWIIYELDCNGFMKSHLSNSFRMQTIAHSQ